MATEQRNLHIITEILGVVGGITLLVIANNIPQYTTILRLMGITTLAVDLYFIKTWMEANSNVNYVPNY